MTGDQISAQEFGQLFMRYRDNFIAVARSYVRDEVVAEDIVAVAAITALQSVK